MTTGIQDLNPDSDACDNYPEVGIARLSVNSNQDLNNQIAKIKAYMLGTYAGNWVKKMTLVAHQDPWADSGIAIADTFTLHSTQVRVILSVAITQESVMRP